MYSIQFLWIVFFIGLQAFKKKITLYIKIMNREMNAFT